MAELIIHSQKCKTKLSKDGFIYTLNKKKNDKCYWKCENRNCKGTAVTVLQENKHILRGTREHNHCADGTRSAVLQALSQLKEKASTSKASAEEILQEVLSSASIEVQRCLPSVNALRQQIKRARKRDPEKGISPLPKRIDDLTISGSNAVTEDGKLFFQKKLHVLDGTKIYIFATDTNLKLLSQASTILFDGNFNVAPTIFSHLHTIHAEVKTASDSPIIIPLVYTLMSSQSETAFIALFETLQDLISEKIGCLFKPRSIITDFKYETISAVRKVFIDFELHGCFFHLAQSVWQQIVYLGFQTQYMEDENFSIFIRQLIGLALLPPEQIQQAYEELKLQLHVDALPLLEWWEENYMYGAVRRIINGMKLRKPPLFPPIFWSVQNQMEDGVPWGTNTVEVWHHRFQSVVSSDIGIFRFIEELQLEQAFTEVKLSSLEQSDKTPYIENTTLNIKTEPHTEETSIENKIHCKQEINENLLNILRGTANKLHLFQSLV